MSEYQHVVFQAVDGPLSDEQFASAQRQFPVRVSFLHRGQFGNDGLY